MAACASIGLRGEADARVGDSIGGLVPAVACSAMGNQMHKRSEHTGAQETIRLEETDDEATMAKSQSVVVLYSYSLCLCQCDQREPGSQATVRRVHPRGAVRNPLPQPLLFPPHGAKVCDWYVTVKLLVYSE